MVFQKRFSRDASRSIPHSPNSFAGRHQAVQDGSIIGLRRFPAWFGLAVMGRIAGNYSFLPDVEPAVCQFCNCAAT